MNENAFHGAMKKGRGWRIALSNYYVWLQTSGWRMHERKRNSWGTEKRGREWRIALSSHSASLQTRWWRTHERKSIHGAPKKG